MDWLKDNYWEPQHTAITRERFELMCFKCIYWNREQIMETLHQCSQTHHPEYNTKPSVLTKLVASRTRYDIRQFLIPCLIEKWVSERFEGAPSSAHITSNTVNDKQTSYQFWKPALQQLASNYPHVILDILIALFQVSNDSTANGSLQVLCIWWLVALLKEDTMFPSLQVFHSLWRFATLCSESDSAFKW